MEWRRLGWGGAAGARGSLDAGEIRPEHVQVGVYGSRRTDGQGRNELEASRPDKVQAKAAWLATWDERHDELPGRHKAHGNSQNGKCGSGSSKGDLRG